MNSFNPDQNPQILSSPESLEGGGGGSSQSSVPQIESEIMNPAELTAEQAGENLEGEATIEGGEVTEKANPDFNIENLASLITEAAEKVNQEVEQSSFETDPDTGLSLQGAKIEELKAQLEAIQKGETSEIDNEIQADRSTEKEILLANLENLNKTKTEIDNQIQATGKSLEDLIKASPELDQRLELLQSKLSEAEQNLAQYEEETTRQLLEARQSAENQLKSELESTQEAYVGSDAELSDRKILLEMGLQDNLTNPDQLFSEQNIQQVLNAYELQEGMDRLQQLRTESNEAREQVARAEIQTDIFQNSYNYQNNPDLAQALDQDIETKLQTLQANSPDSDTISMALNSQGLRRLDYLTNSKDAELNKLVFWEGYYGDKTEVEILAENPNFAKYVEQQTEKRYALQRRKIESGEINGRSYLGSEADRQLQQYIDTRIENQFTRAKTYKLQALRTELTSLQSDENGDPFDRIDQSMSSDRENLRQVDIDKFQAELEQALQDGIVKFENGKFISAEDIPAKNASINQELAQLLSTTKPVLEMAGYLIESLDGLSGIAREINQNKEKAEKRPFGLGKNTAKALEKLDQEVSKAMEQYNQLQSEKQSNKDKFQVSIDSRNNLQQAYNKLPKSIQDTLSAIENPSLDTITKAITSGVEEIQNYQTPPEITERREKISSLESQIAETEAITAPATQATT
jgi:hypothetical protein